MSNTSLSDVPFTPEMEEAFDQASEAYLEKRENEFFDRAFDRAWSDAGALCDQLDDGSRSVAELNRYFEAKRRELLDRYEDEEWRAHGAEIIEYSIKEGAWAASRLASSAKVAAQVQALGVCMATEAAMKWKQSEASEGKKGPRRMSRRGPEG